jgi:predicted nucleic acid-binding protein
MSLLVDTNLLTRISEPDHAQYPVASDAINTLLANGEVLHVAPQNLYEFWAVATRPVSNNGLGMSIAEAKTRVDDFLKVFRLLSDTPDIFPNWLKLVTDHECRGKTAHDARLAAIMHVNQLKRILTFNAQDFTRYTTIEVLAPEQVGQRNKPPIPPP